jgi:hypothetical protein
MEKSNEFGELQRQFLPELQAMAQVYAYRYARNGNDKAATANHLITLRVAKAFWAVQPKSETKGKQWWNNEHSLNALHSTLASFSLNQLNANTKDRTIAHSAADVGAGAGGAGAVSTPAAALGTRAAGHKTLSSGYNLYGYQLDALDTLHPFDTTRGIARVPATISVDELYAGYISQGRPVVIGKGLLANWGAQESWRLDELIRTRGGIGLKVARGPKPGINPKDTVKLGATGYTGDEADEGSEDATGNGADGADGPPVPEQDSEEEAQRRWDFFMADVQRQIADGFKFNEADMCGARFSTEFYTRGMQLDPTHALRATNGIPLGCTLLLPVHTVNCVQPLKDYDCTC